MNWVPGFIPHLVTIDAKRWAATSSCQYLVPATTPPNCASASAIMTWSPQIVSQNEPFLPPVSCFSRMFCFSNIYSNYKLTEAYTSSFFQLKLHNKPTGNNLEETSVRSLQWMGTQTGTETIWESLTAHSRGYEYKDLFLDDIAFWVALFYCEDDWLIRVTVSVGWGNHKEAGLIRREDRKLKDNKRVLLKVLKP